MAGVKIAKQLRCQLGRHLGRDMHQRIEVDLLFDMHQPLAQPDRGIGGSPADVIGLPNQLPMTDATKFPPMAQLIAVVRMKCSPNSGVNEMNTPEATPRAGPDAAGLKAAQAVEDVGQRANPSATRQDRFT